VEGRLFREASRRREIVPFPAMPWPLVMPDSWPLNRNEQITLPYLFTQQADSTFVIPKGYRLASVEPISKSNLFGKVEWDVQTMDGKEGQEAKVRFLVEATALAGRAMDYKEFQTFMGWIQSGMEKTLVLEKVI
jgi:hypothetical protein